MHFLEQYTTELKDIVQNFTMMMAQKVTLVKVINEAGLEEEMPTCLVVYCLVYFNTVLHTQCCNQACSQTSLFLCDCSARLYENDIQAPKDLISKKKNF